MGLKKDFKKIGGAVKRAAKDAERGIQKATNEVEKSAEAAEKALGKVGRKAVGRNQSAVGSKQ
jgi:hypothetical protein